MKKKVLSLVLVLVLLLTAIPIAAIPASAASSALSFSNITFTGYKGWMNPSQGGQERYKQRGYDLGLQAGTLANIMSGSAAQAQSNNVGDYYPELYLNASGQLVRDSRYDNVNVTIDLNTYLAEGYGKYYGIYKFELSAYAELDTFTVYNQAAWWHLNRGFDILYSADGNIWTKKASYTNMGNYDNWDSSSTTSFGGKDCLLRTTNFGGVRAKYIAVAVTDPAGGGPNCALWYATATGTAATSVPVSSVTYKSYQSYLSGTYSNRRSWDRFTLTEGNQAIVNCETDKGGTVAYKAYSYPTKDYFPAVYLNNDGQLVRDSRYDNNGTDVNLATYLTEGYGKYYGVYIIKFATPVLLDSFVVYNNTSWYHLSQAFDVLYSADGNIWTKKASYTSMGNYDNWDSSSTTSIDGASCLKKTTDMGGVYAWYVAVAISSPAGQDDHRCCLWYTESMGRATKTKEVYASDATSLTNAVTYANSNPGTTIKVTRDIVCADDTSFGTLSGANTILDGQNHTIYNLHKYLVEINGAGITVKNFTISNKTASNGSEMSLTGGVHVFGDTWGKIAGGTSASPVVIENVNNQRNVSNVGDMSGLYARTVGGYVTFKNCTNSGNLTAKADGNYKVGGFVGNLEDNNIHLTFENCTNSGNISGSQAGGFLSVYHGYNNTSTIVMTNCTNSGKITAVANGSAKGIAGGLIGGTNNAYGTPVSHTISITLTGCQNTGDVVLDSTASNSNANALGGLIGHAGYVDDTTTVYQITMTKCAVYDCSIDAIDTDNSHGDYYAAGLIGKISPKSDSNISVKATNCYLSKVSISAANARKFIGVGSFSVNVVSAENCMAYNLTRKAANGSDTEWDSAANAGCSRVFTASAANYNGFDDTDTSNVIMGVVAQKAKTDTLNKVRFLAAMPNINLKSYERVGFYIVALTDGATSGTTQKVWIKNTEVVYTSVKVSGTSQTSATIFGNSSAQYMFVSEITEIPQGIGNIDFYVTPFIVTHSGSILHGASVKITVDPGTVWEGDPQVNTSTPINVLSYNLKDGEYNSKSAQQRKSSLASVVKAQKCEVVCLQELYNTNNSYHFNASNFKSTCNNGGEKQYESYQEETTAVMWDRDHYTRIGGGSIDCTISTANGGDGYPRKCTWVKLNRTSDSAKFYVVSVHLDMNKHWESASILVNYIKENFSLNVPVIIAGDFNTDETIYSVHGMASNCLFHGNCFTNANTGYVNAITTQSALQDGWNHDTDGSVWDYGLDNTHNGVNNEKRILDWCYYTTGTDYTVSGLNCTAFSVITSAGLGPSDHYPIKATFSLR